MIKVLVVEDEKIIREGLIESISWDLLNCKIVGQGKNGKEGLELIKTLNPDLVITDIKMPILDGLEMIEQAMEEEFQFKAIILSSYSEFEYAKKGIKLGVLDYILKPLDEDILLETIEKFKSNFYKSESDSISRYLSEEYNIFVRKTVQIILDRYVTKLSIKEIALELDVSASYLSRKIKEETDETFLDILNKHRVSKSILLLKEERYKLYEISEMVGFSDYKHFCTVFKKYFNIPPGDFLRRRDE